MSRMTVESLIEILSEVKEKHGDIEVRIAHQPRWAFEYSVSSQCGVSKNEDRYKDRGGDETVFYLAEGTQIGYLPRTASLAVGWSEPDDGIVEGTDYECFGF